MKMIRKTLVIAALSLLWGATHSSPRAAVAADAPRPAVEIAILLDTSGSMEGLIEQAKSQLWKIVNEFIKARQNGKAPEVRVALFEYGKSSLPASEGFIRMIQPLTNDLDRISEDLFALKTDGGDEYCGWVIREAVKRLTWSSSPDVYRAIFIAGNEPFTQGPVGYAESCKAAISKGIIVNTIHCGPDDIGRNTNWQDGALLADGKYVVIDHNQAVVHIEAPQDREIARLGVEMNRTYLAFGGAGAASMARQSAQDANASSLASAGAFVSRAVTKSSANYRNDSWDLVDAVKNGTRKLDTLKKEELPAEMRTMTETERATYVEAKAKERSEIQTKIQQLNEERNKHIAAQSKARSATNTLDSAVTATVREQAMKKKFQFE